MRNTWVSLSNKLLFSTAVLSMLLMSSPLNAQDGEALFKANCSSCHKVDKKLVGPALQGTRASWSDRTGGDEAIVAWVKNSTDYIKNSGDSYAKNLFAEYNQMPMTAMPLTDAEILAILDYADSYAPAVAPEAAVAESDQSVATESDPTLWLIILVVILLVIFRVLWGVSNSIERLNRQSKGEKFKSDQGFLEYVFGFFKRNKAVTTLIILVLGAYLTVLGWDAINGIGVYQSYQPKQPIWFSHKVHAGQNGINCVYCHNSVEKGMVAGIPSLNICMNCHMGVQEGRQTGTGEIAKIYEAIGWDPEKNRYIEGYDQKPIEWVRIHNLQDFVYFNHSQHVVIGKQECQTCHGEVQEMDEVYQYADLTMGWCINCHRETDVSMEGNGYYERIHDDLVEKHKEEGLESFKVEHIGGLECIKCHY